MNFLVILKRWLNTSDTPLNELIKNVGTSVSNLATTIGDLINNQTSQLSDIIVKNGDVCGKTIGFTNSQRMYSPSGTPKYYYEKTHEKGGFVRVVLQKRPLDLGAIAMNISIDGGSNVSYSFSKESEKVAYCTSNSNTPTYETIEYQCGSIDIPFNKSIKLTAASGDDFTVDITEYLCK